MTPPGDKKSRSPETRRQRQDNAKTARPHEPNGNRDAGPTGASGGLSPRPPRDVRDVRDVREARAPRSGPHAFRTVPLTSYPLRGIPSGARIPATGARYIDY